MFKSRKTLFAAVTILIAALACSMPRMQPAATPPSPTPNLIATITAQAFYMQNQPDNQPPAQDVPSSIPPTQDVPAQIPPADAPPTATFAMTFTPTITLTFTPAVPMVTVSEDTNCRTGPSKYYDNVGALTKGKSAEVVGKNTETGYWIIKKPSGSGTCWLWGYYASVSGDMSKLQEYPIPPTPTPAKPAAPKNLQANKICFFNGLSYDLSGSIAWQDVANENGYNVYVDGGLFNNLPADTIVAALPSISLPAGGSIQMAVEAYNGTGKSPLATVKVECP